MNDEQDKQVPVASLRSVPERLREKSGAFPPAEEHRLPVSRAANEYRFGIIIDPRVDVEIVHVGHGQRPLQSQFPIIDGIHVAPVA